MRPVQGKTYQEQTFFFRIPLDFHDEDLFHLKMEHLS
jgi:hypothetical protein